jgi:uncharacterized protein (TIGR02145 family)
MRANITKNRARLGQIIILILIISKSCYAQKDLIELKFTAKDSIDYIQLDSIKVLNLNQSESIMLYWPDTVVTVDINSGDTLLYIGYATFYQTGVKEQNGKTEYFNISQNYPNPVLDESRVSVYIPNDGRLEFIAIDIYGRMCFADNWELGNGYHTFSIQPGNEKLYLLLAKWDGIIKSIKVMTSNTKLGNDFSIRYIGKDENKQALKVQSVEQNIIWESGIADVPDSSKLVTFQFAYNMPCIGIPNVYYEGKNYSTIQVFSQCWLKDNLNVGTMIQGGNIMTNNGIIEKYCYGNNEDTCDVYGGLYKWGEAMNYYFTTGGQGICPDGWHIPSILDWAILKGAVDTYYRIEDTIWFSFTNYQGYDAALNLKSIDRWRLNGNGNGMFGFNILPAGEFAPFIEFAGKGMYGFYWTSENYEDTPILQRFEIDDTIVMYGMSDYYSVRCIKDYP